MYLTLTAYTTLANYPPLICPTRKLRKKLTQKYFSNTIEYNSHLTWKEPRGRKALTMTQKSHTEKRICLNSRRYSQATALDATKSHTEKRRYHRNQRRSDKRERRASVIANMKEYNSSEITEYSESDIYNITQYNCFHIPEITDHEGESDEKGKKPIKVCRLNWRSDELTDLLQKKIVTMENCWEPYYVITDLGEDIYLPGFLSRSTVTHHNARYGRTRD